MRKITVCNKSMTLENGDLKCLQYYITADELTNNNGDIELEIYGVGVSAGEEDAYAGALTVSSQKAEHLIAVLAEGLVTPITLLDVVADIIAS